MMRGIEWKSEIPQNPEYEWANEDWKEMDCSNCRTVRGTHNSWAHFPFAPKQSESQSSLKASVTPRNGAQTVIVGSSGKKPI